MLSEFFATNLVWILIGSIAVGILGFIISLIVEKKHPLAPRGYFFIIGAICQLLLLVLYRLNLIVPPETADASILFVSVFITLFLYIYPPVLAFFKRLAG